VFTIFLGPLHSHFLDISVEVLGFIAEAILMVWLLVRGVEEQKWVEDAAGLLIHFFKNLLARGFGIETMLKRFAL
jgi:hypothetical protein